MAFVLQACLTAIVLLLGAVPPVPPSGVAAVDRPDPQVSGLLPTLQLRTAAEIERAWARVKALPEARQQIKALKAAGLEHAACTDLVDFRPLAQQAGAPFHYRDHFRGRSHARPSLARVLIHALHRLQAEHPDASVSIGDIAQPGCGQIAYGTLIHQVRGPEAGELLRQTRRVLGQPMRALWRRGADYPLESDRLRADTPVWVEQRVLGVAAPEGDRPLEVRVAERRFVPVALTGKPKRLKRYLAKVFKGAQKSWDHGSIVRSQAVTTWDPQTGAEVQGWLEHRVDARRGRQVVVVSRARLPGGLDPDALTELRLSRWKERKPETFAGETRWRPHRDADGMLQWQRLVMLGEAGHVSHLAGRDADLSYVTLGNADHHRPKVKSIDVDRTWRWFELLEQTGRELGTPVDKILVGKRVRWWLARKLPREARKTELWRSIVAVSPGHDAHHHLRVGLADPSVEAQALSNLQTLYRLPMLGELRSPPTLLGPLPPGQQAGGGPVTISSIR